MKHLVKLIYLFNFVLTNTKSFSGKQNTLNPPIFNFLSVSSFHIIFIIGSGSGKEVGFERIYDYSSSVGCTHDRTDGASGRCRTSVLGAQLGDHVLSHVGAFLRIFQLLLHLAEFRQVQGGDLFLQDKERQLKFDIHCKLLLYYKYIFLNLQNNLYQ